MQSNNYKPLIMFIRKGAQKYVVDDAEDDGASTDTKCQGECGEESKAGIFAQIADCVTEVAQEIY
jgi:hypothetical protein